ncbi:extracellular solute-binding protein [Inmirania thermothiophila]|nr:extracellular solute-binding protein [Inmirania thermothiophila]
MRGRLHAMLWAAMLWASSPLAAAEPVHALAMWGQPKYGAGFTHFDYVDPNAPKGGDVRLAEIGTFDSLNPFILKGIAPAGIGMTFDTLTVASADEPFTRYGLVAESMELAPDRSWIVFNLRPEARFHDGSPITAEDVVFTFETLRTRGHPFYRAYYASVDRAEVLGPRRVRFAFKPGANRELPLIVAELPVLSKRDWQGRDFTKTTLQPILGSGPYRVKTVDPGRSVTYERVRDYWAKDLPVNRGRFNFDRIRIDYYRDTTVALEAFKAGEYDFREENVAKNWATAYDFPALRQGLVKKVEIPHRRPAGMQGFVFNTRRWMFRDRRVREALGYAFDFAWTNRNLFHGAYTRTTSYFANSELAATGTPGPEELAILARYRGRVPEEVFTRPYAPPPGDPQGDIRGQLRTAMGLLRAAGFDVRDGRMVERASGRPFRFEILLVNPSFERIALPFARNLRRLGIEAGVRTVDPTQYQNRLQQFDFDMTVAVFPQSLSPGNEQRDFWTSAAADTPGSRNLAGIRDPVVDELVELLIAAPDRASLVARARALDRVLLWGHYVIPHWHLNYFRVAYWDLFGRPPVNPPYALAFDTWWVDRAKAERIAAARTR